MWGNEPCGLASTRETAAHHCVAINGDGQRVLSTRVINDEDALPDLIPSCH